MRAVASRIAVTVACERDWRGALRGESWAGIGVPKCELAMRVKARIVSSTRRPPSSFHSSDTDERSYLLHAPQGDPSLARARPGRPAHRIRSGLDDGLQRLPGVAHEPLQRRRVRGPLQSSDPLDPDRRRQRLAVRRRAAGAAAAGLLFEAAIRAG